VRTRGGGGLAKQRLLVFETERRSHRFEKRTRKARGTGGGGGGSGLSFLGAALFFPFLPFAPAFPALALPPALAFFFGFLSVGSATERAVSVESDCALVHAFFLFFSSLKIQDRWSEHAEQNEPSPHAAPHYSHTHAQTRTHRHTDTHRHTHTHTHTHSLDDPHDLPPPLTLAKAGLKQAHLASQDRGDVGVVPLQRIVTGRAAHTTCRKNVRPGVVLSQQKAIAKRM
jgi:hypothetical protein